MEPNAFAIALPCGCRVIVTEDTTHLAIPPENRCRDEAESNGEDAEAEHYSEALRIAVFGQQAQRS